MTASAHFVHHLNSNIGKRVPIPVNPLRRL